MFQGIKIFFTDRIDQEFWLEILPHLKQQSSVMICAKNQDLYWACFSNDMKDLPSLNLTLSAPRKIIIEDGLQLQIPSNSQIRLRAGEGDSAGYVVFPEKSCPFIFVNVESSEILPSIQIYGGSNRPNIYSRQYYTAAFKDSNCEVMTFSFLRNREELVNIGKNESTMSDNYFLLNDIDCNKEEWKPIGGNQWPLMPFRGVFEGDSHIIHGVVMRDKYDESGLGFFSASENATIKNILLKIDYDVGKEVSIAGLVGIATRTKMTDVVVQGTIKTGPSSTISGIVGAIEESLLERVTFKGTLSAIHRNVDIAGIAGRSNNSSLKEVIFEGTMTAGESAVIAGICLDSQSSQIDHSMVLGREIRCHLGKRRDPIINQSICAGMVAYAQDTTFKYCAIQCSVYYSGTVGYISGFCGIGTGIQLEYGYSNMLMFPEGEQATGIKIIGGIVDVDYPSQPSIISNYYYSDSLGELFLPQRDSNCAQFESASLKEKDFLDEGKFSSWFEQNNNMFPAWKMSRKGPVLSCYIGSSCDLTQFVGYIEPVVFNNPQNSSGFLLGSSDAKFQETQESTSAESKTRQKI